MALTRCAAIETADVGAHQRRRPSIAKHPFSPRSPATNSSTNSPPKACSRAAEVWEVAATIAMLASDYTTYLTGEVVSISSQRA